jgi:hypothetical protein
MAGLTGGFKGAAIAALPLDGTRTIIGVGGADGTVLAAILAAHAHMHGVLFDIPPVVVSTPAVLAEYGVGDRPSAWQATSWRRSRPAAMPTWPRSSCMTGPGRSWRTSPRPAAAAHGC